MGINSVGVDMQPKRYHNVKVSIYFVTYIFIVNVLILNMFAGVVIEAFNRFSEKMKGYCELSVN